MDIHRRLPTHRMLSGDVEGTSLFQDTRIYNRALEHEAQGRQEHDLQSLHSRAAIDLQHCVFSKAQRASDADDPDFLFHRERQRNAAQSNRLCLPQTHTSNQIQAAPTSSTGLIQFGVRYNLAET